MRVADELHRMDLTMATSPMPSVRFVFDPSTSRPIHVLLNAAMQELTARDSKTLRTAAGEMLVDLVHGEDKTDLNRAFFQAIAKRRSHAFVNLRLSTGPDEAGNPTFINRTEHQFLQFYPNGRLAAVTVVEDTEPIRGLLSHSLQLPPRQLATQQADALAALLGPTASALASAARSVAPSSSDGGGLAEHVRRVVQRMAPTDKLAQWMLQYVLDHTGRAASLTDSSRSSGSTGGSPRSKPLPLGMRYLMLPNHAQQRTPHSVTTPVGALCATADGFGRAIAAHALDASSTLPGAADTGSRQTAWQSAAHAFSMPPNYDSSNHFSDATARGGTPGASTAQGSDSRDCDADSTGAVHEEEAFGVRQCGMSPTYGASTMDMRQRQLPEMTASLWHTLTPFQQVLAHTWGDSTLQSAAGSRQTAQADKSSSGKHV